MKHFIIVLFVIFSFSTLFAQANKDYDGVKPEVYAGSKSLVFTYTPFQSNLGGLPSGSLGIPIFDPSDTTFDSTSPVSSLLGLGFKIFPSNNFSLVIGLSYGSASTTEESESTTEEASASVFGISAAGNFHLPSLYSINTYVGGSINFASLSSDASSTTSGNEIKAEFSTSSFGIGAHIGFDWFFTEGISLGGQYTFLFQTSSEPEITVSSSEGGSETTQAGPKLSSFGTGVGTIVLNVHF